MKTITSIWTMIIGVTYVFAKGTERSADAEVDAARPLLENNDVASRQLLWFWSCNQRDSHRCGKSYCHPPSCSTSGFCKCKCPETCGTTPTTNPPTKPSTKPPTKSPTASPTANPTASPTANPTASPTANPTASPTANPTASPTANPTASPTANPTASPTANPTASPTANPTEAPTANPTASPTANPTASPTTTSFKDHLFEKLRNDTTHRCNDEEFEAEWAVQYDDWDTVVEEGLNKDICPNSYDFKEFLDAAKNSCVTLFRNGMCDYCGGIRQTIRKYICEKNMCKKTSCGRPIPSGVTQMDQQTTNDYWRINEPGCDNTFCRLTNELTNEVLHAEQRYATVRTKVIEVGGNYELLGKCTEYENADVVLETIWKKFLGLFALKLYVESTRVVATNLRRRTNTDNGDISTCDTYDFTILVPVEADGFMRECAYWSPIEWITDGNLNGQFDDVAWSSTYEEDWIEQNDLVATSHVTRFTLCNGFEKGRGYTGVGYGNCQCNVARPLVHSNFSFYISTWNIGNQNYWLTPTATHILYAEFQYCNQTASHNFTINSYFHMDIDPEIARCGDETYQTVKLSIWKYPIGDFSGKEKLVPSGTMLEHGDTRGLWDVSCNGLTEERGVAGGWNMIYFDGKTDDGEEDTFFDIGLTEWKNGDTQLNPEEKSCESGMTFVPKQESGTG